MGSVTCVYSIAHVKSREAYNAVERLRYEKAQRDSMFIVSRMIKKEGGILQLP
jgi:hypothetical protein